MAGFEVVYANDNDKHACDTYELNHGPIDRRSVDEVTGTEIGAVDLLWASCPCQPWSNLGKRLGEKDPRNKFPAYLRVLGEMPWLRATAWENVPPLAVDPYFKRIVRKMRALGYGVAARKLNAGDLGVAQNRERLICVGIKGATDDAVSQAFPRVAVPSRLGVGDICPDFLRVEGYDEYYRPIYRPASCPMSTVTANGQSLEFRRRDGSLSKPTIAELLALSSFPSGFKFPPGSSDADCHARIGNAVPPLMAMAVAVALSSALLGADSVAAIDTPVQ